MQVYLCSGNWVTVLITNYFDITLIQLSLVRGGCYYIKLRAQVDNMKEDTCAKKRARGMFEGGGM